MWTRKHQPTPTPATRKLKNVLVLHSHNASADYMSAEDFNSTMAPNLSNWDDDANKIDEDYLHPLQTKDGIQFFHFKHRVITDNPSDSRTIAPCMDALEAHLASRGEKLDAIVVPAAYGTNYQNAESIKWLMEMKKRFPDTKVLVDGYLPESDTIEQIRTRVTKNPNYVSNVMASRFAIPKKPEAVINNGIDEAMITQDHPDYILAAPIDLMRVNSYSSDNPKILRELVGMPPLPKKVR